MPLKFHGLKVENVSEVSIFLCEMCVTRQKGGSNWKPNEVWISAQPSLPLWYRPDPVSFVIKTPAEVLEIDIREEHILRGKVLQNTSEGNVAASDSRSGFVLSKFEIGEQDRLLKATPAMQYPVSGEQNPFVSWPQPHQANQEKSVIELEESVYWKEYWGSTMGSYSTKDVGTDLFWKTEAATMPRLQQSQWKMNLHELKSKPCQ